MTLAELLAGVAVVLAIEGLLYALAPSVMRRALLTMAATPEGRLRWGGVVAAAAGILLATLLIRGI
ncbi:DUF2065 domain-containing protein [Roseomonas elaeocarpi]|uniref:DUF2065 domain-containing protein n=1 Tax=Roseomonas elaeocarpi TaxID=907779 RepID=A0ABV6JQA1_9PROT